MSRLPHFERAIVDIRKNALDHSGRRRYAPVYYLLGAVMETQRRQDAAVLDVVALLAERPGEKLARGQVGTIVERIDDATALVEFSDDEGRAYAVVPCRLSELIVLHYAPQAA
jgi:uncharacterized protein DUF4926